MNQRKPFIAGNWKMNKTHNDAIDSASRILAFLDKEDTHPEVMIAPSATSLHAVGHIINDTSIALGCQNMHWSETGAFTGELSAKMVTALGCKYVIVGHSERRQFFGETDAIVNKKIKTAKDNNLCPILCVGESEDEQKLGQTFDVIQNQITRSLMGVETRNENSIVIAYEPVWAIGTGKTATSKQAQEVHAFIRKVLADLFDDSVAENIRILYGGSVTPENINELIDQSDIDGALVGGASLDADTFAKIILYESVNNWN